MDKTNKTLDILSFNVLNRQFSPIQMLFKKYNLEKSEIKQLVRSEIKRFNQVIGPNLIKYFKLISPHTIIFLQEVNSDFLSKIQTNFSDKQVFSTTEPDYLIQKGKANRIHRNIYDDLRVIIIPEFLSKYKISFNDIQFESEFASKPILKVSINFPDFNLVLINLHLHWKLTNSELTGVGEKIFGHIKKTFVDMDKVKIIISGDFNKGEKKVENYFLESINKNSQIKFINPHKTSNGDFTSHTTDIEETKIFDVIDHIIIANINPVTPTEISSTIKSIPIMINSSKLLKQLTHGQQPEENISDHLIIKLKVQI